MPTYIPEECHHGNPLAPHFFASLRLELEIQDLHRQIHDQQCQIRHFEEKNAQVESMWRAERDACRDAEIRLLAYEGAA